MRVLIVEDHPMMIEAYKNILQLYCETNQIFFHTAFNSEQAYKLITTLPSIDVAIVDVILPSCEERKINSGADIGILIKKHFPSCKIMLLTSHSEIFVLSNLIDAVVPDALMVKSDFNPQDLLIAFTAVLNNEKFHSTTVRLGLQMIKKIKFDLDATNRQIISLLANGVLTKNIPNYLDISLSAVDKRKSQIKIFFNIEKGTDQDIIAKAKEYGFI